MNIVSLAKDWPSESESLKLNSRSRKAAPLDKDTVPHLNGYCIRGMLVLY
jgi:hypothetical protein